MGRLATAALLVFLGFVLFGCTKILPGSEPETKYVCSDGKTVVADLASCPPAPAAAPVAAPPAVVLTQEVEMAVCSGMPSLPSQGVALEDVCIIGLAAKHENTTLCRKVGRDQRMTCYVIVAELKNNPDICLEAESQASQCLEQYAREKNDGSVCGRITEVSYRNSCYSSMAGKLSDLSICEKITDVNQKDSCYSQMANQLSDPALCEKMRNLNNKDNCYFDVARRFGDSSYCDMIASSDRKESCLQELQGRSIKR